MDPKDDPEARIRELERSLNEQARTSELGVSGSAHPPPSGSFGPQYPVPGSFGGAPFPQLIRSRSVVRLGWLMFAITAVVGIAIATAVFFAFYKPTSGLTVAPGGSISVSGSSEDEAVVCNGGGSVSVSGFSNTVTVTGQCTELTVSGFENKVVVDSSETIDASGFNNEVIYHFGTPHINKMGDNVVQQG